MKLLSFFFFCVVFLAGFAHAQEDMAVYKVTDVIVDVTSANAALARETAMVQAQRGAFGQLMERLGSPDQASKTSDNAVASFVQALDVQKEHAAGLRYTGTFSVQFKPEAVRNYLSGKGVTFTEARSKPTLVLPILRSKGRDTLWEDMTPWYHAWAEVARNAGLVPMILPEGGIEDVSKITAAEAVSGKADALQGLMQKYAATSVIVPILQAELDAPDGKTEALVDVLRFDSMAAPQEPLHIKLPPIASTKAVPDVLANGARQIAGQMERGWRQSNQAPTGPSTFLPVDVPVPTLAAWTQIRNKMRMVTPVAGSHIITMTRGLVHAEIEFRGDIPTLQQALSAQGLFLEQAPDGSWSLRDTGGNGL